MSRPAKENENKERESPTHDEFVRVEWKSESLTRADRYAAQAVKAQHMHSKSHSVNTIGHIFFSPARHYIFFFFFSVPSRRARRRYGQVDGSITREASYKIAFFDYYHLIMKSIWCAFKCINYKVRIKISSWFLRVHNFTFCKIILYKTSERLKILDGSEVAILGTYTCIDEKVEWLQVRSDMLKYSYTRPASNCKLWCGMCWFSRLSLFWKCVCFSLLEYTREILVDKRKSTRKVLLVT